MESSAMSATVSGSSTVGSAASATSPGKSSPPIIFNSIEEELTYWKQKSQKHYQNYRETRLELEDFSENSRQLEAELEETIKQQEKYLKDTKQKLNSYQNDNEFLRKKLSNYEMDIERYELNVNQLNETLNKQKQYVRELEQKNDDLERAHRIVTENVGGFEAMLNQAYEKNALLEIEIDEKELLQIQLQRFMDEIRDLKQELTIIKSSSTIDRNVKLRNESIDGDLEIKNNQSEQLKNSTNRNHSQSNTNNKLQSEQRISLDSMTMIGRNRTERMDNGDDDRNDNDRLNRPFSVGGVDSSAAGDRKRSENHQKTSFKRFDTEQNEIKRQQQQQTKTKKLLNDDEMIFVKSNLNRNDIDNENDNEDEDVRGRGPTINHQRLVDSNLSTSTVRLPTLNVVAEFLRKINFDRLICPKCDKFRCICNGSQSIENAECLMSSTTTTTTTPPTTSQSHHPSSLKDYYCTNNNNSSTSMTKINDQNHPNSSTEMSVSQQTAAIFKRLTHKVGIALGGVGGSGGGGGGGGGAGSSSSTTATATTRVCDRVQIIEDRRRRRQRTNNYLKKKIMNFYNYLNREDHHRRNRNDQSSQPSQSSQSSNRGITKLLSKPQKQNNKYVQLNFKWFIKNFTETNLSLNSGDSMESTEFYYNQLTNDDTDDDDTNLKQSTRSNINNDPDTDLFNSKWTLICYPNGRKQNKYLSLYLKLADCKRQFITVKYFLTILDSKNRILNTIEDAVIDFESNDSTDSDCDSNDSKKYNNNNRNKNSINNRIKINFECGKLRGFEQFLKLTNLLNYYLENNTLIISCQLQIYQNERYPDNRIDSTLTMMMMDIESDDSDDSTVDVNLDDELNLNEYKEKNYLKNEKFQINTTPINLEKLFYAITEIQSINFIAFEWLILNINNWNYSSAITATTMGNSNSNTEDPDDPDEIDLNWLKSPIYQLQTIGKHKKLLIFYLYVNRKTKMLCLKLKNSIKYKNLLRIYQVNFLNELKKTIFKLKIHSSSAADDVDVDAAANNQNDEIQLINSNLLFKNNQLAAEDGDDKCSEIKTNYLINNQSGLRLKIKINYKKEFIHKNKTHQLKIYPSTSASSSSYFYGGGGGGWGGKKINQSLFLNDNIKLIEKCSNCNYPLMKATLNWNVIPTVECGFFGGNGRGRTPTTTRTRTRTPINQKQNSTKEQNLINDFKKLLFQKLFSDVTLICVEEQFENLKIEKKIHYYYAHKLILSVRSPVFMVMFNNDYNFMETSVNPAVTITNCTANILKEFLRFLYTGECKNLWKNARELLIVSDRYQCDDLKFECEKILTIAHLTKDTAIELLIYADLYTAKYLQYQCIKCIRNFKLQIIGGGGAASGGTNCPNGNVETAVDRRPSTGQFKYTNEWQTFMNDYRALAEQTFDLIFNYD